ncbi:MAG: hypothetical protein FWD57_05575 [Polyangiaceae bacterium]|nr:hypothetical protein [Polyangiaceae bacterium]
MFSRFMARSESTFTTVGCRFGCSFSVTDPLLRSSAQVLSGVAVFSLVYASDIKCALR